jgi:hypothetical protein
MRYKWDGFLGHDMETAYLGQEPPDLPSSDLATTFLMTELPPPSTPITTTIPDLTTPAWPPSSPWPIVPEAPNPSIPESTRVTLPAPTPSPTGPNNAGIFADIATGFSRIFTPIVSTALPLLERYGAIRPVRGPSRLPLPGEPGYLYASSVYGRAALPSLQSMTPWLLGGGLVLAVVMASRGGRGRR